ncbi:MAG: hypothetical protein JWP75_3700 [Frondihabitans sp.]|nr:hypothetical protein [Frondihabitans sp.]
MSLLPRRRVVGATLAVLALAPLLAACSPTVSLTPEAGANTVACAGVITRLPTSLGGLTMRDTNAQGTGAWGSPSAVLLRCGLPTPDRSTLPCYTLGGIDYLVQQKGKDGQDAILTTYGRTPGVQIVIDTDRVSTSVLRDLGAAVGTIPTTRKCL